MKILVTLIGLILVLEGLPYAAFPESMQEWLKQIVVMPPHLLRLIGFAAMFFGLFLCFLTQRTDFLG